MGMDNIVAPGADELHELCQRPRIAQRVDGPPDRERDDWHPSGP